MIKIICMVVAVIAILFAWWIIAENMDNTKRW